MGTSTRDSFNTMFCADYISSFIFHGLVTGGLLEASHRGLLGPSLTPTKVSESLKYSGVPVLLGGLAGFLGAASVFPFDFVRRGVMPGKVLFRHSLSTVPYAGVFFGLYFSNRDGNRTGSQSVARGVWPLSKFLSCWRT